MCYALAGRLVGGPFFLGVGALVVAAVGEAVGDDVGNVVVGEDVGDALGEAEGDEDGADVDRSVGLCEGATDCPINPTTGIRSSELSTCGPTPICPLALSPKHSTKLLLVTTHVVHNPPEICWMPTAPWANTTGEYSTPHSRLPRLP